MGTSFCYLKLVNFCLGVCKLYLYQYCGGNVFNGEVHLLFSIGCEKSGKFGIVVTETNLIDCVEVW